MRRLESHLIGIDEGSEVLFSDFEYNGPMWAGQGPRVARKHVTFSEPFSTRPAVQVGFAMWDISNTATARMDVRAEDIGCDGFVIAFRTWNDSKIARVRVAWQAIGELEHQEDWKLY